MPLQEEIQQHLVKLDPNLQAEVLDFVLFLEQKQSRTVHEKRESEDGALAIHQNLMEQYAEAFTKLAQ